MWHHDVIKTLLQKHDKTSGLQIRIKKISFLSTAVIFDCSIDYSVKLNFFCIVGVDKPVSEMENKPLIAKPRT